MKITDLTVNHHTKPLGFDLTGTTFSWKVSGTESKAAQSVRFVVASDAGFTDVVHDSGHSPSVCSAAYTPVNLRLTPRTRYYWKVTVCGDGGDEATSGTACFETGKMDEAWSALWITLPDDEDESILPHFRHSFGIGKPVKSARAYACALGLYELYINGIKAGDEYLAPGFHTYDKWLQVQTYDITHLLKEGENHVGAMLGNGWAKGKFGLADMVDNFCAEFGLIAEFHITFEDGEKLVINTGNDWQYAPSPVSESSIYDGEVHDARITQSDWKNACVAEDFQSRWGLGALCDRMSPPVKAMLEIKPVSIIKTPAGENVLDMGQNMVGFLRFRCKAPKGAKLSLYFGEVLQDGNFYRENYRTAKAEFHYISNGGAVEVRPFFTFYGFRYVKLEGFAGIDLDDFTGVVLYSDMKQTGSIETSNDKVNRLFQNVLWGQRGNFLDVPTDCPQRDERLGWTGDAQVFCETAAWNMDVYAFFAKYMRDVGYAQEGCDGAVPHVVPDIYNRRTGQSFGGAACGWADAAAVIPWTMYQMYGDTGILRQAFPVMRSWVDWIYREDERSGARRLWTTGFHFGDWLALDAPKKGGTFGATDVGLLASAYYYCSAAFTSNAAKVLGDTENAKKYGKLADEVKSAFINEFFTQSGRIAVKTQSAMAIALDFRLYPEGSRERLVETLKLQLVQDGMKIKTGFLGTPALCRALTEHGAHSYALRLFFNEEMPGWLYPVNMGATTIWERWDSILPDGKISDTGMNSLNHYSYGCIASWMYRNLCGIIPTEPGFRRVRLQPRPCGYLKFAKASFDSPYGTVLCAWKRQDDGKIAVEAEIPFGAEGELVLPMCVPEEIKRLFPGAAIAETGSDTVTVPLIAGHFEFEYNAVKSPKFGMDAHVYELIANGQTGRIFTSIPALTALPENILAYTFEELLAYINKSFPHLAGPAEMIKEAVLSTDPDGFDVDDDDEEGGDDGGNDESGSVEPNPGNVAVSSDSYFEIRKCEPWLYSIKDKLGVYCYLAVGDSSALLFDAGYGIGDLPAAVRSITDKPLTVVLSHGHADHVLGITQFESFFLHEADFELYIEHSGQKWRDKAIEAIAKGGGKAKFGIDGFDEGAYRDMAPGKPVKLDGNAVFSLGSLTACVVPMPGHTPGSVGLLFPEHKVLLTGDASNRATFMFLPESLPISRYLDMLRRVMAMDFETHYVGHQDRAYPKKWFKKYIKVAENALAGKGKSMKIPGFEEFGDTLVCSVGGPIVSPGFCGVAYTEEKLRQGEHYV